MSVGGIGGAGPQAGSMAGVGIRTLRMANQSQTDMALRLLPIKAAENAGRAATEAKGMFVDIYA